ncbi:MAG: serine/threonine protein kinase, partial [Myxococcales bacterium]|nr:serine/threonine protein kinase [Myxococcales bacterium]
ELIEGRTITEAVAKDGPFDPMRAIRVIRDIGRALRAAHRHEVVHRDLKPSNVMLERTPEGERVKVLDFGLVKVLQEEAEQITQEGEFLGSPKYMSPEQIEHAPADVRSDLYSLGALAYLMLSGHPPFERDTTMSILLAHLHDPVPPLSEHGVVVPSELERVVRRCLEKSPEDRYGSVEDLLADLAGVWADLADRDLARSDAWTSATSSDEALRLSPMTVSADAIPLEGAVAPRRTPWARRLAYGALALGAVALAVVLTVAIERRGRAAVEPDASLPLDEPVAVVPATEPEEVAIPVADPPRRYSLLVESTPPEARLRRDGVEVGRTPIAIELDSTLLDEAPVTLSLDAPGHHPFTWTQGPLGRDGRIHATLVRRASGPRPATVARTEPPTAPADPVVLPWARPNPY